MSEQECTAIENERGERPNPLFVPDCTCPACVEREARHRIEASRAVQDQWLRASGRPQRSRVENLSLGERGQAALG